MIKSIFTILFLFAICCLLTENSYTSILGTKGSGKVIENKREVGKFNNVVLKGSGDIQISQGDVYSVSIETDDNIMDLIKTETNQTSLIIYSEENIDPTKLIIRITTPDIKGFKIEGSGDIENKTPIKTSDLILRIDGAGDIKLKNIEAIKVSAKISGSGDILVSGKTNLARISIFGSGDINFSELESDIVKAEIAGSGDCKVWAKDELDIRISGSGDFQYKGEPKVFKTKTTGSGSISKY